MKQYLKYIAVLGLATTLLTGCSKDTEAPIGAVYTSIETMSYEDALTQLDTLEVKRSNRQEISRLKGICYMGLGQYESAVEAFETALNYNEGFLKNVDYDINQYLASAYFNLGQFEEAEHIYRAMVDLKPKDAGLHYSHGITLLELGRYEDSRTAFDKAVELEPTNYSRVMDIYQAFYQFGYSALGLEYVENAMKNQTNMNDYDKGRMLYHIGQYNQAVSALEKVDKKKYADAAMYLGMSYEAMGDYNYAASVYNSVIENSTNPVLYNQLGLCQMKRGEYTEALLAFQEGLKCEDMTQRQSLRFNEVIAYEFLADFETAKELMKAYLKDYPNDAEAQREYIFLQTR